jgi:hypothetical protein
VDFSQAMRVLQALDRHLKKGTVRGQDLLDAEMLKQRFGLEDE